MQALLLATAQTVVVQKLEVSLTLRQLIIPAVNVEKARPMEMIP
jgi:hypothetical protein